MKRNLLFALSVVLVVLGLSGCVIVNFSGSNRVTGRGEPEGFEFRVGQYSRVNASGYFEIHYYAAASDIVKLEVQPNLQQYYIVEVRDDELLVRTRRGVNVNTRSRPVLTISTPILEQLTISGSNTFLTHDTISGDSFALTSSGLGNGTAELDVESFNVNLSGSGSFSFSGLADRANLSISGSGNLDALDLQLREASVRLSGSGRLGVNSSESLSISASGSGRVSYRGSPRISLNNTGSVRVITVD